MPADSQSAPPPEGPARPTPAGVCPDLWIVERRFKCTDCGMKWFVPASAPPGLELTECGNCGSGLAALSPHAEPERRAASG